MEIIYAIGDATRSGRSPALISHIVNTSGIWRKGFVEALSRISKKPEEQYLAWYQKHKELGTGLPLGAVQICPFQDNVRVANMVAQKGVTRKDNQPLVQYDALETCLKTINKVASDGATFVIMGRIGCGLGGGQWEKIEPIIKSTLTVPTVV